MSRRVSIAVALSLLSFGNALAHMPYLLPNLFDVGTREHVTVQGSFTEVFFEPDVVMKADDYHVIGPDGVKRALKPIYTRDLAVIEVPVPSPGTYRISTGQRTGRTARAAWVNDDWKFLARDEAAPAGSRAYDVTSVTTTDVYVTRGKPGDAALTPRNAGLEFRALTHPSSLFAGEAAKFAVLFDGKPLANQPVSIYDGNARYAEKKIVAEVQTDAAGQFSIQQEKPGVYVALVRHRPTPAADTTQGVSHTASVVFEIAD